MHAYNVVRAVRPENSVPVSDMSLLSADTPPRSLTLSAPPDYAAKRVWLFMDVRKKKTDDDRVFV